MIASALVASAVLLAAEAPPRPPILTAWRVNPAFAAAPEGLRAVLPEVHTVRVQGGVVHVESAGLSLQTLAPLESHDRSPGTGVPRFDWQFPLQPQRGADIPVSPDVTGVFINGVPVYNPASPISWADQNIWHIDSVRSGGEVSPLVQSLLGASGRHSPIIGFALDGYPIYGPFGYDSRGQVIRLRSSYQLRRMTARRSLPDGTELTPMQEGPPVSADYPAGTFAEDYEYVEGSGDLDDHNGRFAKTPEFPDGTYAYFLATDSTGRVAFPYLVGRSWYGDVQTQRERVGAPKFRVENDRIVLNIRDSKGRALRQLERTHEQQIHLIVVSRDLTEFHHVHPQLCANAEWCVPFRFSHGGDWLIYADYAKPGEAPRVDKFVFRATGESVKAAPVVSPSLRVKMNHPDVRTGTDINFRFDLTDQQGHPVTDLQSYLGAWAHVIFISNDGEDFIHVHPADDVAMPASNPWQHVHVVPGPSPASITASTGFRRAGNYKVWLQVQRDGEVLTFPFDVHVEPGAAPAGMNAARKDAIRINVSSAGFDPVRITIEAGRELRLDFVRRDAQNCASSVVFPELHIRKDLPPGEVVPVDIPARALASDLYFACGMGMFRGSVVVR